jgi:hypothetical protein
VHGLLAAQLLDADLRTVVVRPIAKQRLAELREVIDHEVDLKSEVVGDVRCVVVCTCIVAAMDAGPVLNCWMSGAGDPLAWAVDLALETVETAARRPSASTTRVSMAGL